MAISIQSVLDQTYREFEIVVVDDGSTDSTPQVAAEFKDHIRYIHQANLGLAGARNTGIRAAKGELLAFLDADDEWRPNYLETMVSILREHPNVSVLYCAAHCMDVTGNDLPQVMGSPIQATKGIYHAMLKSNHIIPSTVMTKREVLLSEGLFDQQLRSCEDWDLWLRLAPKYDFLGSPARLVRYRIHGSSLSANLDGMRRAITAVYAKHFGPEDEAYDTWSEQKRRAYGGAYRYLAVNSLIRLNDWLQCKDYFARSIAADPAICRDLDFFWDLALGNQPVGYRGSSHMLDLLGNRSRIIDLLSGVFNSEPFRGRQAERRLCLGTAYYALGLIAYNTRQMRSARQFLVEALRNRPELLRGSLAASTIIKSILGREFVSKIRNMNEGRGFSSR